MYLEPIREPPHQNSVRLEPCKKIAAIQGHCPLGASTPPTIRPAEYSCWPQSSGSIMFSLPFESNGLSVVLVIGFMCGINTRLGEGEGLKTVDGSGIGQHTPGTNRLLKQSDSRKLLRFKSKAGQLLKSSQRPGRPLGVLQRFSTSFGADSLFTNESISTIQTFPFKNFLFYLWHIFYRLLTHGLTEN
uniref:Uncharacterized protein n=1 Tax=Glossina pallidipes TaxID=7398 RepID=A0A1A9Z882_GLOPL